MEIIYILLSFIVGIFIFYILREICKCSYIEGYGLFGRVNLQKCCPKGYMFSKRLNECVAVCDGCSMAAYGKLKLENIRENEDEDEDEDEDEFELAAHYECGEHDAKNIYDYDKINRRYNKPEDQHNFYSELFDDPDMESGSGVQASEEGDNEAWASIDMELPDISNTNASGTNASGTNASGSDTQEILTNRIMFCNNLLSDSKTDEPIGSYTYDLLCPVSDNWETLCGEDISSTSSNINTLCDYSSVDGVPKKICDGDKGNIFCN